MKLKKQLDKMNMNETIELMMYNDYRLDVKPIQCKVIDIMLFYKPEVFDLDVVIAIPNTFPNGRKITTIYLKNK